MDLDPSLVRIASELFAQRGIDFNAARRAGGWTNANWIASGLVLRLSTAPGRDSLGREAQLAAHPEGEWPRDPYCRLLSLAVDRGGYLAGV